MLLNGANALFIKKERLNKLNVFPVPDGDTGINMYSTLEPILHFETKDYSLHHVANELSMEMLKASRGNSGTILATFFLGMASRFNNLETASIEEIIQAFKAGKEYSYKNIANPQEGTILTVMSETCDVRAEDFSDIKALFKRMKDNAKASLKKTPELLPVLKRAGVVDSGAFGFTIILEAMYDSLLGKKITADSNSDMSVNFADYDGGDFNFTYCLEGVLEKSEEFRGLNKCSQLKSELAKLGDSEVFVETQKMIKLHIHSDDEKKIFDLLSNCGTMLLWKVENMKEQLSEMKVNTKKYSIIPVLIGDGFLEVFMNVGISDYVDGGKTMNVSYDSLMHAIDNSHASIVYLLPNNKDTIPTCDLIARQKKSPKIIVIPTLSMSQGIACALAFKEDRSRDENELAMLKAMKKSDTFSVTLASKDFAIGDLNIEKGDYLVLFNNMIIASFKDEDDLFTFLCRYLLKYNVVTIYYGSEISEDRASDALSLLENNIGDNTDVMLVYGGQSIYRYIISGE